MLVEHQYWDHRETGEVMLAHSPSGMFFIIGYFTSPSCCERACLLHTHVSSFLDYFLLLFSFFLSPSFVFTALCPSLFLFCYVTSNLLLQEYTINSIFSF